MLQQQNDDDVKQQSIFKAEERQSLQFEEESLDFVGEDTSETLEVEGVNLKTMESATENKPLLFADRMKTLTLRVNHFRET